MGAVKQWLMEQEEREYDERLQEYLAREDEVGFKESRKVIVVDAELPFDWNTPSIPEKDQ
jgi:hypothetical protein